MGDSKRLQGRLLVFLDVEQTIQLRDLEDLEDFVVDIAHHQLAAGGADLLVERYEFTQSRAGKILDIGEVQQDFLAAQFLDQAEQVFADLLDVLFVKDFAVDEIDDRDVLVVVFDLESAAASRS